MKIRTVLAAVLVATLGACATRSGGPPPVVTTPDGRVEAPPRATLESEQRRLAELFQGTPVVFAMQPDGSLRVSVPLAFSFDRGRFAVKPPLGKVLDLVARSQRPETTRLLVSAPSDPQGRGLLLATERAASARDFMIARGLEATRFTIAATGGGDSVVVVVSRRSPP